MPRTPTTQATSIRLDAPGERYTQAVRAAGGSRSRLMRSLLLRHVMEVEAAEREVREAGYDARGILELIRRGGDGWAPAMRLCRAVEDGDEALRERLIREI